mgnify:CR=1 FL=1
MKKIIIITAMIMAMGSIAQAEIQYNYKDSEHKMDKKCIAMFSIARDVMSGDELRQVTDYQNRMILKYAYSKQLNTHVSVAKDLLIMDIQDGVDVSRVMLNCINRADQI